MKRTKEKTIPSLQSHIPIWLGSLLVEDGLLGLYHSILSPDERERAKLFKFPKDRNRYIKGRYLLRQISALYLDESPQSIRFGYNEYGKPFFKDYPAYFFNLSHSNELFALVLTNNDEIGIDIEFIQNDMDFLDVGNTVFSTTELLELSRQPEEQIARKFYEFWTRKESLIKAFGYGFSMPVDIKDISVNEDQVKFYSQAQMKKIGADQDWKIQSFEPKPGFMGAITYRVSLKSISFQEYSE